jgi:hypothetical protein
MMTRAAVIRKRRWSLNREKQLLHLPHHQQQRQHQQEYLSDTDPSNSNLMNRVLVAKRRRLTRGKYGRYVVLFLLLLMFLLQKIDFRRSTTLPEPENAGTFSKDLVMESTFHDSPDEEDDDWDWMKTYIVGKRMNIFWDPNDNTDDHSEESDTESGWFSARIESFYSNTGLFQVKFGKEEEFTYMQLNRRNVRCKTINRTFCVKGTDILGKETHLLDPTNCKRNAFQPYLFQAFKQNDDGTIESMSCPGQILDVTNGMCDIRGDVLSRRNEQNILRHQIWCIDVKSKRIFNDK